jgi:hypothetical protein
MSLTTVTGGRAPSAWPSRYTASIVGIPFSDDDLAEDFHPGRTADIRGDVM